MTKRNTQTAPATPAPVNAPGVAFGNVAQIVSSIPAMGGNPFAREGVSDAGRYLIRSLASAWDNQPAFVGYDDDRAEQYEAQSFAYILGAVIGGLSSNYRRSLEMADKAAQTMSAHMQSEEHDRQGVAGFAAKGEQLMDRAMIADARAAFVGHLIEGAAQAYEEIIGQEWKPYVPPGPMTSKAGEVHATAAKDRMAAFLASRKGG